MGNGGSTNKEWAECRNELHSGPKSCNNSGKKGIPLNFSNDRLVDLKVREMASIKDFCYDYPLTNDDIDCPCNGEFRTKTEMVSNIALGGGARVVVSDCERINYGGNPQNCCINNLRNLKIDQNNKIIASKVKTDGKFGDGSPMYTCDPKYTSPQNGDSPCGEPIANYCSLFLTTQNREWESPDGACAKYISLFPKQGQPGQKVLKQGFEQYFKEGHDLAHPNPIAKKYLKNLLDLCEISPGACEEILQDKCKNYTREDLLWATQNSEYSKNDYDTENCSSSKPCDYDLVRACACHLPQKEYLSNGSEDTPPQCDPLCQMPNVISKIENGIPKKCDQTVCILDDVTVNAVRSTVGNISFKTLCGSCSGKSESGSACGECYFHNINVNNLNEEANLSFEQKCGACYEFDPARRGWSKKIDCGRAPPHNEILNIVPVEYIGRYSNIYYGFEKYRILIWISIAILFVILLSLLFLAKK